MPWTPAPRGPVARLHRVELDRSAIQVLQALGLVYGWSELHRPRHAVCHSSSELLGGSVRNRSFGMNSGRPPVGLRLSQPTVGRNGAWRNPGFRNSSERAGRRRLVASGTSDSGTLGPAPSRIQNNRRVEDREQDMAGARVTVSLGSMHYHPTQRPCPNLWCLEA